MRFLLQRVDPSGHIPFMARLVNDSSRFNIVNLDPDHPGKGPFIILQLATDPNDPSLRERGFILAKNFCWIKALDCLGAAPAILPRILFESYAEVGDFLENLTGAARIETLDTPVEESAEKIRQIESIGGLRSFLRQWLEKRG